MMTMITTWYVRACDLNSLAGCFCVINVWHMGESCDNKEGYSNWAHMNSLFIGKVKVQRGILNMKLFFFKSLGYFMVKMGWIQLEGIGPPTMGLTTPNIVCSVICNFISLWQLFKWHFLWVDLWMFSTQLTFSSSTFNIFCILTFV